MSWGFEQIKIWNIHIKIKCVPSVKRWLKVTQISLGYIDNTLDYKSQVELSLQKSYSNRILYHNAAATSTCDAATTMLPPLQPTAAAEAGCYVIEYYQASLKVNVM